MTKNMSPYKEKVWPFNPLYSKIFTGQKTDWSAEAVALNVFHKDMDTQEPTLLMTTDINKPQDKLPIS